MLECTAKTNPAELPAPGLCELVDVITASTYPHRFATITVYRAHSVIGGRRAGRMPQTSCPIARMRHFTLASYCTGSQSPYHGNFAGIILAVYTHL